MPKVSAEAIEAVPVPVPPTYDVHIVGLTRAELHDLQRLMGAYYRAPNMLSGSGSYGNYNTPTEPQAKKLSALMRTISDNIHGLY